MTSCGRYRAKLRFKERSNNCYISRVQHAKYHNYFTSTFLKKIKKDFRTIMMWKSLLLLFCLVSYSVGIPFPGLRNLEWEKLNPRPVCFSGRNSGSGIFKPRTYNQGFLAAVKLVHRSGKITCDYRLGKTHYSNWGCHSFPNIVNTPLNVFITDESNQILFPKVGAKFTTGVHKRGKWYSISGFDSQSSHLVLQNSFSTPFYIGPKSSLKLWYGEDLFNYAEGDNRGRVCADVYGHFL